MMLTGGVRVSAKDILVAVEIFLMFLFLAPLPVINSGNILGLAFSAALILITRYNKECAKAIAKLWHTSAGKPVVIAAGMIILAGLIYVTVLSVKMYKAQENRPDKPETVIVLGCRVKGKRPTRMLRRRLDAAFELMINDPDCLCIVSGGQGSGEVISEACAMKDYLVEKGTPENRIIMEDKSTSTFENLKFSKEIIQERNLSENVTIVTDGFHEYRASLIAKKLGYHSLYSCPAYTEPRYVFTYWVREWLGLTHFFILGK